MDCSTLTTFRAGFYRCLLRSGDALMNLSDALLTETQARSLPELSLSAHCVRRWPSLYQALQNARIDRTGLQRLLAAFVPLPTEGGRLVLGIDTSPMARPVSPTARDRTAVHAPNLPPGCKPVTLGWQFSTLVALPEQASSFTYVLDNQRIPSEQTPAQVGAEQLRQVVAWLPVGALLLGDRHYSSIAFLQATQDIPCDKLLRLQKHRVLYRPAPPPSGNRGRPREDGERFQPKDPTTHGEPDACWEGIDESGHRVEVSVWNDLHFRALRHQDVSILRVVRHSAKDTARDPKVSWFVWIAEAEPPLSQIAPLYRRRYSQEHGYRFEKQALLWQTPRLRTPEQMQVWTDMVACVKNQLVLARAQDVVVRLPWESEKRQATPQQVRRGMNRIVVELGTPARLPKLRGKSPGRKPGAVVEPAPRFPVIYKTKKKTNKTTALV
jgi:hypothetical protein